MRIVLCYPNQPQHLAAIQRVAPEAQIVNAGQEAIAAELPSADIYCGHAKVPVPWPEVVRRGRLQWIQSTAAGTDHCLVPEVVHSDILVTSASGVLADQVAEQTLALLLALLRSLPEFARGQQRREFVRRPTRDLHRATVCIVGLGGNGRRLAQILRLFKTTILATDWYPEYRPDCVDELLAADQLDSLLPRTDILILAAPLNRHTHGMIGARRLALLPQGALLINVARGPLVVERELVEALRSAQLGGAGLDVTEIEPLPPESPLWDLPNVIITPHVGGQCATRADDITNFFCENLRKFVMGEPLRNVIDKELGFPRPESGPPC